MFLGKVVLITGASSSVGARTAMEFAKLGAHLAITGFKNEKKIQTVGSKCPSSQIIMADLTKETDVEKIIKNVINRFNKLDVLVNNAETHETGSIEKTCMYQYDRVMNINVRGPYYLTMLATPHLIKSKGNIINVSSVSGLRSFPNSLVYCMSKSAIDQFTRCIALELAPKGVRVNAVNPDVNESRPQYQPFVKSPAEIPPLGRATLPHEVSSAIIFLASDAASNITGVTFSVDGGRQVTCPPPYCHQTEIKIDRA